MLLSSDACLLILEGGLRPPSFLMSLLVGALCCHLGACLVIGCYSCLFRRRPSASFFLNESPCWGFVLSSGVGAGLRAAQRYHVKRIPKIPKMPKIPKIQKNKRFPRFQTSQKFWKIFGSWNLWNLLFFMIFGMF